MCCRRCRRVCASLLCPNPAGWISFLIADARLVQLFNKRLVLRIYFTTWTADLIIWSEYNIHWDWYSGTKKTPTEKLSKSAVLLLLPCMSVSVPWVKICQISPGLKFSAFQGILPSSTTSCRSNPSQRSTSHIWFFGTMLQVHQGSEMSTKYYMSWSKLMWRWVLCENIGSIQWLDVGLHNAMCHSLIKAFFLLCNMAKISSNIYFCQVSEESAMEYSICLWMCLQALGL